MIAVRLIGRLGNQLFQYAFAYSTAKTLDTKFYLDPRFSQELMSNYFSLGSNKFRWIDKFIFAGNFAKKTKLLFKLGFYSRVQQLFKLNNYITFSNEVPPQQELAKITDKKTYIGFFQSELYFADHRDKIIQEFRIKRKLSTAFNMLLRTLPSNFKHVVIHIRRTDYITENIALPASYFHKAIESIEDSKNFYILISDDPEFAETEFNYLQNKYVSNNSEITDLQFLINADICILSNSSFSWWGAYLNCKNAEIIAPKYWLGHQEKIENPIGILPSSWRTIDF